MKVIVCLFFITSITHSQGIKIHVEMDGLEKDFKNKIPNNDPDQKLFKAYETIKENIQKSYEIATKYFSKMLIPKRQDLSQIVEQAYLIDGCDDKNYEPSTEHHLLVYLVAKKDVQSKEKHVQSTRICTFYNGIGATNVQIEVNVQYYKDLLIQDEVSNAVFYDAYLCAAVHELLHALGLSLQLLNAWVNNEGIRYQEPIIKYDIVNKEQEDPYPDYRYPYLSSPNVLLVAQDYYKNHHILGAPLSVENPCEVLARQVKEKIYGYYGREIDIKYDASVNQIPDSYSKKLSFSFHWESEFIGNEILGSEQNASFVMSEFTRAALLDTGFYKEVEEKYFDLKIDFGRNMCNQLSQNQLFTHYNLNERCEKQYTRKYVPKFNAIAECSRVITRNFKGKDSDAIYKNKLSWQIVNYSACNQNEKPFTVYNDSTGIPRVQCFVEVLDHKKANYSYNTISFSCSELNRNQKEMLDDQNFIYCPQEYFTFIEATFDKKHCEDYCEKKYICRNRECVKI